MVGQRKENVQPPQIPGRDKNNPLTSWRTGVQIATGASLVLAACDAIGSPSEVTPSTTLIASLESAVEQWGGVRLADGNIIGNEGMLVQYTADGAIITLGQENTADGTVLPDRVIVGLGNSTNETRKRNEMFLFFVGENSVASRDRAYVLVPDPYQRVTDITQLDFHLVGADGTDSGIVYRVSGRDDPALGYIESNGVTAKLSAQNEIEKRDVLDLMIQGLSGARPVEAGGSDGTAVPTVEPVKKGTATPAPSPTPEVTATPDNAVHVEDYYGLGSADIREVYRSEDITAEFLANPTDLLDISFFPQKPSVGVVGSVDVVSIHHFKILQYKLSEVTINTNEGNVVVYNAELTLGFVDANGKHSIVLEARSDLGNQRGPYYIKPDTFKNDFKPGDETWLILGYSTGGTSREKIMSSITENGTFSFERKISRLNFFGLFGDDPTSLLAVRNFFSGQGNLLPPEKIIVSSIIKGQ